MIVLDLFAPAKVNLSLEITGRRENGYHDIRSFVCFADIGDQMTLSIEKSDDCSFSMDVSGLFAADVPQENTLTKAFRLYCENFGFKARAHVDLVKNLPSRAGMGSASSDAAALLRGLHFFNDGKDNDPALFEVAAKVGADVPVCLHAAPCLVEGVGERLTPADFPIKEHALLVWPGPGDTTERLYQLFDSHMPLSQTTFPWPPHPDFGTWLHRSRNDFEPVAMRRTPEILDIKMALDALPECFLSRMTGSGTAVFGLFSQQPETLPSLDFPWVQACSIGTLTKPLVTVRR